MLFQTEEWTTEQRKPHRCQDSSGNEDKLEKYIRRYVISSNIILSVFIELHFFKEACLKLRISNDYIYRYKLAPVDSLRKSAGPKS
jgi:hypothetical protein